MQEVGTTAARNTPPNKNPEYVVLPSVSQVHDTENKCQVWIIEAPLPNKDEENTDILALSYSKDQFDSKQIEARKESKQKKDRLYDRSLETIISEYIFKHEQRPRYVIVASPKQLILIDRFKWPYKQILRFNLEEIFERQDPLTLNVFACFISRKALVPKSGVSLAERLEEESQRHANAVTSSLKRTVRDAIEILGNEVLQVCENKYPKGHSKAGTWIESKNLTQECLRFMYQLLFLFLVEANPKYEIIPLKDPTYNQGYSLEALRHLEFASLRTEEDKTGTFLWESLQVLLRMMEQGVRKSEIPSQGKAFELPQIRVSLLDSKSTPILSNENVALRNKAVQEIIQKLSINQDKSGRGRISYVNLGIGQLGAVYETLIAFTGTVTKTEMLELVPFKKKKGAKVEIEESEEAEERDYEENVSDYATNDKVDLLAPSYFVEKSRASEFKPEQIVYKENEPKVYKSGSFIYRLAGRDRQKTASYYTPEPLARVLVKHTLMERCKGLKADELLDLKILEPAMGSAAFLVETTNQLAEMYLELKQEEVGRQIPQNEYFYERQRVRSYIADRNCFGVDLNPIAIELGEVSLWLNGLHKSEFSPWFGDQLIAGNSLIGARRASYPATQLKARKRNDLWFNKKPVEIGWSKSRPKDHIWHFLLPDIDMAKFEKDKSIAGIAGEYQEKIKIWRGGGVFTAYEADEIEQLIRISEEVDKLFDIVAEQIAVARKESNEKISVWPQKEVSDKTRSNHVTKRRKLEQLTGESSSDFNLPYKRLKTVMDAWCALWLWPLEKAHLLPSRRDLIHGLSSILLGNVSKDGSLAVPEVKYIPRHQASFIGESDLTLHQAKTPKFTPTDRKLIHETNIDALTESLEWIQVANALSLQERFTHFELYFADIMRDRGGFDLIVGNPPWISQTWNSRLELISLDPANSSLTAVTENNKVNSLKNNHLSEYLNNFVRTRGAVTFMGSTRIMPISSKGRNNSYKCFIDLSFRVVASVGFIGLIHQDSHLGDSKAGEFRSHCYHHLVKNFNFINEIKSKNFLEVGNAIWFSLNIYRGNPSEIEFDYITNLYLPSQIEESYIQSSEYTIPLLRLSSGKWDTRGHSERIVQIKRKQLETMHALSENSLVPVEQTRIVKTYSKKDISIIKILSRHKSVDSLREVADGRKENITWGLSDLWNETIDRKNNIIRRSTQFTSYKNMIIQGPFFHVGNPFYKTPNENCSSKLDYTNLDLLRLPDNYLPRSNYVPGLNYSDYRQITTTSTIDTDRKHTDYFRVVIRGMLGLHSERRLIGALLPPDIAHVHSVRSIAFSNEGLLLNFHSLILSTVLDYLLLIKGRTSIFYTDVAQFRWVGLCDTALHRGLKLACLTEAYSGIWNRHARHLQPLAWSRELPKRTIKSDFDYIGSSHWGREVGLRSDFARRLALVEIDVLVAQAFELTLEQLVEIYKIYFPVLEMYESATWYDSQGKIVWTNNSGLSGVGWRVDEGKKPSRRVWEDILVQLNKLPEDERVLKCKVIDDTLPEGPREIERIFIGPFFKCNRVEDYERAWKHFEKLKGVKT